MDPSALAPFDQVWPTILFMLAAARATRLITHDTVTEPFRLWASHYDFTRQLVHCPWCIGFWISAFFVFVGVVFYPDPWVVLPIYAFAVSQVVGMLAAVTNRQEDR